MRRARSAPSPPGSCRLDPFRNPRIHSNSPHERAAVHSSPDVQQLTSLALAASARNDSEAAISHLKHAIAADGADAVPHFLLGAEYAQIGLVDRALEEFTRAVESNPNLHTARFQLGLLLLTSGRVDEAASAWQPLDALEERDPLRLFRDGMLRLVQDDFDAARVALAAGVESATGNPALAADMRKVIERIDAARGAEAAAPDAAAGHVLVSAYRER